MTSGEWRRAVGLATAVIALHVIGFGLLFIVVAPAHLQVGSGVFGVGLGLTAYMLGLRHAFDADHIGAIDNTTRTLMADGRRPLAVGFFFALGHASVVFMLAVGLAVGLKGLDVAVADDSSRLQQVAATIGPLISGSFLLLVAILNAVVLRKVISGMRRLRDGRYDEEAVEQHLAHRGVMGRVFGRATAGVASSWQMYPVGLLFGLGFDTATEVALLATAGTAAAGGLPLYAVACLPILFAAGMTLLDTIDGIFMSAAYGWALAKPVRKLYYNFSITLISVVVALAIGSIEVLSVLADRFTLHGPVWDAVANVDLDRVGYLMVGLFGATWVVALATWRLGRVEQRWAARLALEPASDPERT